MHVRLCRPDSDEIVRLGESHFSPLMYPFRTTPNRTLKRTPILDMNMRTIAVNTLCIGNPGHPQLERLLPDVEAQLEASGHTLFQAVCAFNQSEMVPFLPSHSDAALVYGSQQSVMLESPLNVRLNVLTNVAASLRVMCASSYHADEIAFGHVRRCVINGETVHFTFVVTDECKIETRMVSSKDPWLVPFGGDANGMVKWYEQDSYSSAHPELEVEVPHLPEMDNFIDDDEIEEIRLFFWSILACSSITDRKLNRAIFLLWAYPLALDVMECANTEYLYFCDFPGYKMDGRIHAAMLGGNGNVKTKGSRNKAGKSKSLTQSGTRIVKANAKKKSEKRSHDEEEEEESPLNPRTWDDFCSQVLAPVLPHQKGGVFDPADVGRIPTSMMNNIVKTKNAGKYLSVDDAALFWKLCTTPGLSVQPYEFFEKGGVWQVGFNQPVPGSVKVYATPVVSNDTTKPIQLAQTQNVPGYFYSVPSYPPLSILASVAETWYVPVKYGTRWFPRTERVLGLLSFFGVEPSARWGFKLLVTLLMFFIHMFVSCPPLFHTMVSITVAVVVSFYKHGINSQTKHALKFIQRIAAIGLARVLPWYLGLPLKIAFFVYAYRGHVVTWKKFLRNNFPSTLMISQRKFYQRTNDPINATDEWDLFFAVRLYSREFTVIEISDLPYVGFTYTAQRNRDAKDPNFSEKASEVAVSTYRRNWFGSLVVVRISVEAALPIAIICALDTMYTTSNFDPHAFIASLSRKLMNEVRALDGFSGPHHLSTRKGNELVAAVLTAGFSTSIAEACDRGCFQ